MLSFGLKGMAATWKTINYTDCFSFTETDPEAYTQAVQLKEQIKNVSYLNLADPNRHCINICKFWGILCSTYLVL